MTGFISSSPFQNMKRFLQIQSLAPGIARRSSGWFQLRRQLRRAITLNPCIVCRIRGYRCVRLVKGFVAARSVRRLDPRISSNRRISSRLRRGSSSPVRTSLTLPSPSPAAAHLPPPFTLPGSGGGGRRRRSRSRATRPRAPLPVRASCALCSHARARLGLPMRSPFPSPPLSLPRMRGRR
jgi:hypothetical protein